MNIVKHEDSGKDDNEKDKTNVRVMFRREQREIYSSRNELYSANSGPRL